MTCHHAVPSHDRPPTSLVLVRSRLGWVLCCAGQSGMVIVLLLVVLVGLLYHMSGESSVRAAGRGWGGRTLAEIRGCNGKNLGL